MTTEKVALVSAAGKGMGAAIARELASSGYRVALMSPSERALQLAQELGDIGIQGSVTVETDVARLVKKAMDKFGRIDAVVIGSARRIERMDAPVRGTLCRRPDTHERGLAGLY